jgi:AraC-like DNA-binding protein
LRSKGIPLNKIAICTVAEIESALSTSRIRAMEIMALAEFQSVPSIGERFAHDLISLGYYSLRELNGKNPVKLYNQLEKNIGAWIDPCVEDQFRLVVHYANHRSNNMNWWDFTSERKLYHEKHGYAKDRPRKAWHELDQYKKTNKVSAKSIETKNDLVARLTESMSYIKRNYADRINLSQLSKIALLSPFHFQRSFKSLYELSPLEFITHLRLKKASRLLKQTKKPITEITVQCGFESTSSFIRLFKKRFSQTPLSYRNSA